MTETPKEVYIDSYENRTFVGTWHAVPPEGAECIKYVPESELTRLTAALKVAEGERDVLNDAYEGVQSHVDFLRAELTRLTDALKEKDKSLQLMRGLGIVQHNDPKDCPNWWDGCNCYGARIVELESALKVAKGKLDASDFELGRERYENDSLRAELARVRELLKELASAESCPYCPNVGWYAGTDKKGDPEQVQCEWCGNTSNSIYQVRNRAADFLASRAGMKEEGK